MKIGAYRIYFKIPFTNLGIKIARVNFNVPNTLNTFLCGIIMNILERKRYKRYVLGKSFGYKFKPSTYSLCPTLFSCGIINIVKHAEELPDNWEENPFIKLGYLKSPFCEDKDSSLGILDNHLVEIDYGDFSIYWGSDLCVRELDYK